MSKRPRSPGIADANPPPPKRFESVSGRSIQKSSHVSGSDVTLTDSESASFHYFDAEGKLQPTFCYDPGVVVLKTWSHPPSLFQAAIVTLVKESPVFTSMLTPEKLATCGRFNGHPVILLDDDPEDLQAFISTLHVSTAIPKDIVFSDAGISHFSAIMRLATKYDAKSLRERMISLFTGLYPSCLTKFNSGQVKRRGTSIHTHFTLLNLAYEVNVKCVLPALFYCASGSAIPSKIRALQDEPSRAGSSPILLDTLKDICLNAREAIMASASKMVYDIGLTETGCQYSTRCREKRMAWAKEIIALPAFLHQPLEADLSGRLDGHGLCDPCVKVIAGRVRHAQEELWKGLPKMFGLGENWEALLGAS